MQRRRIAVAAVVAAAAGTAVAFTLPSDAGTRPSAVSAPRTDGDVAPPILAAMRRDLGVDGDQARARLKRASWASGVQARLARSTGPAFGGAWLADDGRTLKVAVTSRQAADAVDAAGAEPVMVQRSKRTLDAAKGRLDAARTPRGVTGWYVDVPTNQVVVVAKPNAAAAAQRWAANAGLSADEVTVTATSASPKPLFDARGADPFFISVNGGVARCSIGFSVVGGFVTAGHCGAAGATTNGFNQIAQGTVQASVFPGDADQGFVAVNGDWTPRAVVNDFRGNELPVAGSTEAPIGAAVCRSGSTTGTHCGVILAKDQTVVYPEGAVTGLTRSNACAESGDSGGPWLTGDQAQGVTSGGSGDCTVGGETFFQPIGEILQRNNLTLITTSGGGAPPPAPPQDNVCTVADVVRQGQLSGGAAEAQPDGAAFQANSGQLRACLVAGNGADFDLLLQRLDAGRFQTVAKASGSQEKTLSVDIQAGVYRYVVVANSGSSPYVLRFDAP